MEGNVNAKDGIKNNKYVENDFIESFFKTYIIGNKYQNNLLTFLKN